MRRKRKYKKDVTVTGREKSSYSIWEKMQRRQVRFEQLSDIMAFRIIVPTREACYMALGVVHAEYQMIAGRFKDYISTPKGKWLSKPAYRCHITRALHLVLDDRVLVIGECLGLCRKREE